jgi:pimeloyl-ACP methyl ester carboxylesterase
MNTRGSLAIDTTITLEIDGSRQSIRLCAARSGLPPLLIVQGGPGLPLLNEVAKFQRLLNLEQDFLVAYWDQRGCGDTSASDARTVSLSRQVADLRTVLRWLHGETRQRILLFGISWGGTVVLEAADHELDVVRSIIGISPDLHTAASDAGVDAFLRSRAIRSRGRLGRRISKLRKPPYLDLAGFQRRARLLADLGTIEHTKNFGALFRELLVDVTRTYGVVGGLKALRNLNAVLRTLLPEVAALDLVAQPPRVPVPVHYVFGGQDVLTSASALTDLPSAITPPGSTIVRVPNAGHLVHFDRPDVVRSIVVKA